MQITEKIKRRRNAPYLKPITLAFFGDSVTQGCFECYVNSDNLIDTVYDQEESYAIKVKKILSKLYPSVPFNVVNGGMSGASATSSLGRIERDVIDFNPDIAVVCFGLNDCGAGEDGIGEYEKSLGIIFDKLSAAGIETVFMTPNTINYNVSPFLTDKKLIDNANALKNIADAGVLDKYVSAAVKVAESKGVRVCDCYKKWKTMKDCGVNVTELLANKLNHPERAMHWLFAYSLVECMFG